MKVLLVAPNVSKRMGGEALKALNILLGLRELGIDVIQLTHDRVQNEMNEFSDNIRFFYSNDTAIHRILHRLGFTWALVITDSILLQRAAQRLIYSESCDIVHFTAPISPTLPYILLRGCPVIIGPLNGNILHPPALIGREKWSKRAAVVVLKYYQIISGLLLTGKRNALLFVSGGQRTIVALKYGGCVDAQIIETLDAGVDEAFTRAETIDHRGTNNLFLFVGRLVRLKGCDLAIRAVAMSQSARLRIIGDGEERPRLQMLVDQLGVADRVTFVGWVTTGEPMRGQFDQARGAILPSLAEANGIAVQEAMMAGLPVMAVNWGGPAQLLDSESGFLIDPLSEDHIVNQMARTMDRLSTDPDLANKVAKAARDRAEARGFAWPSLLREWIGYYTELKRAQGETDSEFAPVLST